MTCIIQSQWLPAAMTLCYTADGVRRLDQFEARNNDTVFHTLSVWIVPNLTITPDNSHLRLTISITPGQNYLGTEIVGHDLNAGDSIWWMADTAMMISARCSARLIS